MTVDLFGRILDGALVEEAVKTVVQRWMPTYLREFEEQRDIPPNRLLDFRGWEVAEDVARWPETQLPALLLACDGLSGPPVKEGDGTHTGRFALELAVVVAADTENNARRLAKFYAAVVRTILLQKGGMRNTPLQGLSRGTGWTSETYGVRDLDDRRTLAGAICEGWLEVEELANAKAGPAEVLPPHDPDWPVGVDEVVIEVEPEELTA